jgi:hydroxymethylglutaryl-CoA lyase
MTNLIKTSNLFIKFVQSEKHYLNKYMMKGIIKVRPFDVTLRDGLQELKRDEHQFFTTERKKEIYRNIIKNHSPKNIEIGSMVNPKILPIFNDTKELLECFKNETFDYPIHNYVLVPNQEYLMKAISAGFDHFSFITSVSNSFQLKNTKMSLDENYITIINMMHFLDDFSSVKKFNVKLYISCINECPIEGFINTDIIIENIARFNDLKPDKICLSDTCGTLSLDNFNKIMSGLIIYGINVNNLSLHLHVKPDREDEIEQIFHKALDYGIKEFDVSELQTGGCSVTMKKDKLAPNMSYDQYYKFLKNYILN